MANVEFRIMPNDIKDGREVVARGVTDTEPAACEGMKRRKSGASCISRKLCRARVVAQAERQPPASLARWSLQLHKSFHSGQMSLRNAIPVFSTSPPL